MKIYQLYKYGGQWYDHFNDIIGTYLSQSRAEEEKAKAEFEDKKDKELARHCSDCPLCYGWGLDDKVAKKCKQYCNRFAYVDMGDDGFDCANYTVHWDEVYFRIEEVEVIK